MSGKVLLGKSVLPGGKLKLFAFQLNFPLEQEKFLHFESAPSPSPPSLSSLLLTEFPIPQLTFCQIPVIKPVTLDKSCAKNVSGARAKGV